MDTLHPDKAFSKAATNGATIADFLDKYGAIICSTFLFLAFIAFPLFANVKSVTGSSILVIIGLTGFSTIFQLWMKKHKKKIQDKLDFLMRAQDQLRQGECIIVKFRINKDLRQVEILSKQHRKDFQYVLDIKGAIEPMFLPDLGEQLGFLYRDKLVTKDPIAVVDRYNHVFWLV